MLTGRICSRIRGFKSSYSWPTLTRTVSILDWLFQREITLVVLYKSLRQQDSGPWILPSSPCIFVRLEIVWESMIDTLVRPNFQIQRKAKPQDFPTASVSFSWTIWPVFQDPSPTWTRGLGVCDGTWSLFRNVSERTLFSGLNDSAFPEFLTVFKFLDSINHSNPSFSSPSIIQLTLWTNCSVSYCLTFHEIAIFSDLHPQNVRNRIILFPLQWVALKANHTPHPRSNPSFVLTIRKVRDKSD